ncbi:MAG: ribonuclease H-like domain-containing protein [Lachnospira eligens]
MITINDTLHTNADISMLKAICPDTDSICFFDIETTGFSRNYNIVYLIGAIYFRNGYRIIYSGLQNPIPMKLIFYLHLMIFKRFSYINTF